MDFPYRLSPAAVRYAWQRLLEPFGGDAHALSPVLFYGPLEKAPPQAKIVVLPTAPHTWDALRQLPPHHLDWVSAQDALPAGVHFPQRQIPVLFWSHDKKFTRRFVTVSQGRVVFGADLLAATLFMLTRWEETAPSQRDAHGRFPAQQSVAWRQGFLDRPIVDEYAWILRAWLHARIPSLRLVSPPFRVKPTHDIDHIAYFWSQRRWLQQRLAPFFAKAFPTQRRPAPSAAAAPARPASLPAVGARVAPYLRGIRWLADLSSRLGLQSAFYLMDAAPSTYDDGYNLHNPGLQSVLRDLKAQGHELGWHASYHTACHWEAFQAEKQRIEQALGLALRGGRQHYLRFCAPQTWRQWEAAGLAYDSTIGYAAAEGFRAGTCHPYPPFDWERDRVMTLLEYPLIVMDVTLRNHRRLSPQEAVARVLFLATQCRFTGGTMTLLWHNTSLSGSWRPWRKAYQRLLTTLAQWAHEDAQP